MSFGAVSMSLATGLNVSFTEFGHNASRERRPAGALLRRCLHRAGVRPAASRVPVARLLEAVRVAVARPPSDKTLDELAQDLHTRADAPAHLMAAAEMELRRTRAQLRATACMLVASIAAAVSAASAAVAAGIAVYLAFHGGG
jgi:hypothetical protein